MSYWITRYLTFSQPLRKKEENRLMDIPLSAFSLLEKEHNGLSTYVVTLEDSDEAQLETLCATYPHYISTQTQEPKYSSYDFVPEPICIAEDLYVVDPSLPLPSGHCLLIEAGPAFGTGQHPSTQLLLRWLQAHDLSGLEVCDVGSGSGILSVYACQRGAQKVCAVDIDPVARERTLHHAELNGVSIEVSDSLAHGPYDLIVSNCELGVLRLLKEPIIEALRPGGRWVITGIISRSLKIFKPELPSWPTLDAAHQGPWILRCFQKPEA